MARETDILFYIFRYLLHKTKIFGNCIKTFPKVWGSGRNFRLSFLKKVSFLTDTILAYLWGLIYFNDPLYYKVNYSSGGRATCRPIFITPIFLIHSISGYLITYLFRYSVILITSPSLIYCVAERIDRDTIIFSKSSKRNNFPVQVLADNSFPLWSSKCTL